MTSRDVIWRHHVKFLQNYQKMFFSMIWRYGAKMKLYAPFKTELWIFSHIMTSQPHHSTIIDDVIAKMTSQFFLQIFLKVYSHSHHLGKFHDSPTIFTVFTEGGRIRPPRIWERNSDHGTNRVKENRSTQFWKKWKNRQKMAKMAKNGRFSRFFAF